MKPYPDVLHDGVIFHHELEQHSMKLYEVLVRLKKGGTVLSRRFYVILLKQKWVILFLNAAKQHERRDIMVVGIAIKAAALR